MNMPVQVRFRSWSGLTILSVLLGLAGPSAGQVRERPDPDAIRKKVEQLELDRQEKAHKDLERLRSRRIDLISKSEYAKKWILSHYDFEISSVIREPKSGSANSDTYQRIVERYQKKRLGEQAQLYQLVDRDEAMRGAIANGRALNLLLKKCGAPAYDHMLYRELTARQGSLSDTSQPAILLEMGSAGIVNLDESVTRHIRYTRGLVGNKETGRLSDGPLDLAWPAFLRRDVFRADREAIERAKDQALAELRDGKPVENKTADRLLDAVNSLKKRVTEEKRKRLADLPGEEYASWQLADRHAKLLMGGAYRLIEARSRDDVVVETFKSGTIEELIAFMYRNGLEFAPADANGQPAYQKLSEGMLHYYADLEALRASIAELGSSREQEQALQELGFRPPTDKSPPPQTGEQGAQGFLTELKQVDRDQKPAERVNQKSKSR